MSPVFPETILVEIKKDKYIKLYLSGNNYISFNHNFNLSLDYYDPEGNYFFDPVSGNKYIFHSHQYTSRHFNEIFRDAVPSIPLATTK
jgi:hypothetical protein